MSDDDGKKLALINFNPEKSLPETTKKVDKALSNVIDYGSAILAIVFRDNEYVRNFKLKFFEKIKHIPQEDVVEIVPDVGIPLLEKVSYTTSAMKIEAFAESLKKAASIKEAGSVHPTLIAKLAQLSDEDLGFLICLSLKNGNSFPYFIFTCPSNCNQFQRESNPWYLYETNLSNLQITLSCLTSLGLIEKCENKWLGEDEDEFLRHEKVLLVEGKTLNEEYLPMDLAFNDSKDIMNIAIEQRCFYNMTRTGHLLIEMIGSLRSEIEFSDGLIKYKEFLKRREPE